MIDPAWVALSLVEHVGGIKVRALVERFGSAQAVLAASRADLLRVPGIGRVIAGGIAAVDLAAVERDIRRWAGRGVRIVTWHEAAYPPALRTVEDAPATLFVRGGWSLALGTPMIAIVGTRTPSPQAQAAASHLAQEAAMLGYGVVSGLAFGSDKAAHMGALACDGLTLAVLGGGVLHVYPREHEALASAICLKGALISETHPEAGVKAPALVARNRLISGLCRAVIVVETGEDGGAMHAARRALAQGRALYTLDLPASGNQALLRLGAGALAAAQPALPPLS